MADPVEELLPLLGINPAGDRDDSDSSDGSDSDTDLDNNDIDIQMNSDSENDHEEDAVVAADDERVRMEEAEPVEDRRQKRKAEKKEKKKRSLKKEKDSQADRQQLIVNFDQSLPAAHSYLGNDLEEIRGRTIFEENSVVTLPLLLLPSVVLVPGQVIPLQLYMQRLVAMVRRVADQDKTFGVINLSKHYDRDGGQHFSALGCTAEIFSMKEEMDEPSGISTVRVKARGRQRFKVIEIQSELTGDLMAKVKILPEVSLTHVLEGAWLPSHRRLMLPPGDDSDMIKTAVDRQGRVLTSVDLRQKNRVTKLYAGNYTWWPPWVYKMYDIDWLVEQIRAELHSWCPASLPPDPVDLSFWVAHNLPVNDEMRLRLLSFDSVVQRLRYGLSVIRKSGKLLCCDSCQEEIASKKDVFSMCQEGPLGAFVNPGGYVHEMFTVLAVTNLRHVGGASTEHSWFPGYAWTIVQCRGCHSHMGWMFTATKKGLSPKKFWGLCRSAIKATFGTMENDDEEKELESLVM